MAVTNDIIKAISLKTGQPISEIQTNLQALTRVIANALREGRQIHLEHFGTFALMRLPARQIKVNLDGRAQIIRLAASSTPDFEVSPTLRRQISLATTARPAAEKTTNFNTTLIHNRKSDISFVALVGQSIPKEILSLIPENLARRYQAVPFTLKDKTLSVAMTDPENEEAFNALRKISGKLIKPYLTTQDDINYVLDQYSVLQSELKELISTEEEGEVDTVEEKVVTATQEEFDKSSPVAKIVNVLLKRAVREKASDIHLEPTEEDVQVRFRIDGILRKVFTLPKEIQPAVTSRIKILANLKIDETRLPQDGRIQILLDGHKIDFRISTLPTVNGEKVVARVLDHSSGMITLDQLGLQGRTYRSLEENITKAHGMTLVTGPTGSGKSTTLYAIISRIKDVAINIITMEDPVEYRMAGVNQSQVNTAIGFTFANGLRSILRQDPDVVMVGEIRDKETADIAINAALTGHIVLSSLHTNDSVGAIPRLIDMEIEPFLVTSSLNSVVAQRLCRKICEQCQQETAIRPEDEKLIASELDTLPEPERSQAKQRQIFLRGQGCGACGQTGYRGRIGIFEVLTVTEPIKQLTIKRAGSTELAAQARRDGLITMRQDGILKALAGLTTLEEVWRVTKD